MPIGDITLHAPPVQNDSTALAFQAFGAGLTSFQEARQGPELPSYILDEDQERQFGPSSEFTKKGLKILQDETLTRQQKSLGLGIVDSRGELRKEKEPTPQESLNERIVIDPNGNKGLIDKDGNFDPFRNQRGESAEDIAKQQEKTMAEAFKRANAILRLDENSVEREATVEEVMEQVRLIERVRELMSAPVQPVVDPGGPVTGDIPGLQVAPLPDEGQIPQTPEELAQLIQVKLEEFDAMSPEQRTQTIRDMPDDERELFLEALPQQIKGRLERVEAKIVALKDDSSESAKKKILELTHEYLRILTEFPLFTEAVGGF